jgi:hypothetical protein
LDRDFPAFGLAGAHRAGLSSPFVECAADRAGYPIGGRSWRYGSHDVNDVHESPSKRSKDRRFVPSPRHSVALVNVSAVLVKADAAFSPAAPRKNVWRAADRLSLIKR